VQVQVPDRATTEAVRPIVESVVGSDAQLGTGPEGQTTVTTDRGLEAAFWVLEVSQLSGLARQQAAPGLTLDPVTGLATLTTAAGQLVRVMGAPLDLRQFLEAVRPFGFTGVTIQRGQFLLGTATPDLAATVRLDLALRPGSLFPGVRPQPGGTATITYGLFLGRDQELLPVFADIPGFLGTAQALPEVSDVRAQADGTVTATVAGQPVRFRPEFAVTRSPGTTKRILAEGGALLFETGDGRRQRFTIVP
jgi:hypothetical protein